MNEFSCDQPGILHEALTAEYGYTLRFKSRLLDQRTRYQHIEVFDTHEFGRVLRLDGALQCSEGDEFFYHEPLVHMAAFSHPEPRRALIIGGGDGGAAEELLKHRTIEELTLVEVDQAVIDAGARFFATMNAGLFGRIDARFRWHAEDGLDFIAKVREPFDLIVLDLTDPRGASTALYSTGFYEKCGAGLAHGGFMTLHVASPWAHPDRVRTTLCNLRRAGFAVAPFLASVPLYGGAWLLALCWAAGEGRALAPEAQARELDGPALRVYSAAMHRSMLALPPYVRALDFEARP